MKFEWLVLAGSSVLFSISGCIAPRAANLPEQSTKRVLNDAAFSKIKAGSSTRAQVTALLGAPWRATNYGETYCGCPHRDLQEVWEYRGTDSAGAYKLHIEFDEGGVARTVAKIQGPHNSVTILASSRPDQSHADGDHAGGHHHEGAHEQAGINSGDDLRAPSKPRAE